MNFFGSLWHVYLQPIYKRYQQLVDAKNEKINKLVVDKKNRELEEERQYKDIRDGKSKEKVNGKSKEKVNVNNRVDKP